MMRNDLINAHSVISRARGGEGYIVRNQNESSDNHPNSDALRRHCKTCSTRVACGGQVPKRSLSGKRKQACDQCTSCRRACSKEQPCSECLVRGNICTYYQRQKYEDVYLGCETVTSSDSRTESYKQGLRLPYADLSSHHQPFDFLLNFTKAKSLDEAYNYIPTHMRSPSRDENASLKSPNNISFDSSPSTNPFNCYLDEVEASLSGYPDLSSSTGNYPNSEDSSDPVIATRANILKDQLHSVLEKPQFSRSGPSDSEATVFFSPSNITRYAELFWDHWYRHCPIIHRPTFDLGRCSIMLLATITLVGACMSSLESDHESAKRFLDVVEDIIFSQQLFSEGSSVSKNLGKPQGNYEQVQILQATYLICVLQKWEGNSEAKLRIQRHRFTAYVAASRRVSNGYDVYQKREPNNKQVIRAMGMSKDKDTRISNSTFGFEKWKYFSIQEEVIR